MSVAMDFWQTLLRGSADLEIIPTSSPFSSWGVVLNCKVMLLCPVVLCHVMLGTGEQASAT